MRRDRRVTPAEPDDGRPLAATLDAVAGALGGRIESLGGNITCVVTPPLADGVAVTVTADETTPGAWLLSACPDPDGDDATHDHTDDPSQGGLRGLEAVAVAAALLSEMAAQ